MSTPRSQVRMDAVRNPVEAAQRVIALEAEVERLREAERKAYRLLSNVSRDHDPQANLRWAREARDVLAAALNEAAR